LPDLFYDTNIIYAQQKYYTANLRTLKVNLKKSSLRLMNVYSMSGFIASGIALFTMEIV